ncbi:hypothetical protein [Flavobacterium taihuense]|uniref:Uncharacterized protein n=1 Tax=Flavobacterium taihuense TaxID=2857508 RepID=A0ABS6XWC4_9FLAO|nr:hypothetical protein [Flavobacterium taihuense]MBW4360981.1 hypothetical protein [Flavobacterium taihuense]
MNNSKTNKISAEIQIVGVNQFVFLSDTVLDLIFRQANKDKGKIPVKIKLEGC